MQNTLDLFRLEGRVIVVTGAAGLLGKMHVRAILDSGGFPVLLDISRSALENAEAELLPEYGEGRFLSIVADITNPEAVQAVLQQIIGQTGRLDGLINNACNNPTMKGFSLGAGRLEEFTFEQWDADLQVGLYGAMVCSQVFGDYMSRHGGGVILNIASDLGIIAPNQSIYEQDGLSEEQQPKKPVTYSVVKWGLIGLTKYLSTYWADKGVRVNAVAFGGVYNSQSSTFLNRLTKLIPMGRMARKDEYMGTVVYMLSDASSYMTGAVVSVDGGRTAW